MIEKYQLNKFKRIRQTKIISNNVGKILNVTKRSIKSIAPIPLSIILLKAPVCLFKWNFNDKLCRCSNIFKAALLIAFCPIFANKASRISPKPACKNLEKVFS